MESKKEVGIFNWQKEYLGREVKVGDKIGKFIARYDEPSFTVEFEDCDMMCGEISSKFAKSFTLVKKNTFGDFKVDENGNIKSRCIQRLVCRGNELENLKKAIKHAEEIKAEN